MLPIMGSGRQLTSRDLESQLLPGVGQRTHRQAIGAESSANVQIWKRIGLGWNHQAMFIQYTLTLRVETKSLKTLQPIRISTRSCQSEKEVVLPGTKRELPFSNSGTSVFPCEPLLGVMKGARQAQNSRHGKCKVISHRGDKQAKDACVVGLPGGQMVRSRQPDVATCEVVVDLVSPWTWLWPVNNLIMGLHLHKTFAGGAFVQNYTCEDDKTDSPGSSFIFCKIYSQHLTCRWKIHLECILWRL